MTAIRVAINGFDRLGRSVCKIAHDRNDVDIVAIRDTRDAETCAYLLKHDSIYGGYTRAVAAGENKITIGDDSVDILEESSPLKDVWGERKIDVVIDTTGADSATLRKHISAGARQVVALSASSEIETIIMGVNDDALEKIPAILGAADGVMNGVTPVLTVLDQAFSVQKAAVTVVDGGSPIDCSLRTTRTQEQALIPSPLLGLSSTDILPRNTAIGLSVHAPVASVGLAVITAVVGGSVTDSAVNQAFAHAAKEPFYQGIITTTNKQLVSADVRGTSYSATIDTSLTSVAGGDFVQIAAWFDAEWGFANRLVELSVDAGRIARSRLAK